MEVKQQVLQKAKYVYFKKPKRLSPTPRSFQIKPLYVKPLLKPGLVFNGISVSLSPIAEKAV